MTTKVRSCQTVRSQDAASRFRIVSDFGDIGPKLFLRYSVDINHLKGRADPARTETAKNAIITIMEAYNLPLSPEACGRRGGRRQRLAQQFRQRCLHVAQFAATFRLISPPFRQGVDRSKTCAVISPEKQMRQTCAKRKYVRPPVGRTETLCAHFRRDGAVPCRAGRYRRGHADIRRNLRAIKPCEDWCVVVPYENRPSREIPVNHRRVIGCEAMQVGECSNRAPANANRSSVLHLASPARSAMLGAAGSTAVK